MAASPVHEARRSSVTSAPVDPTISQHRRKRRKAEQIVAEPKRSKRTASGDVAPQDEFQQVSLPAFVNQYRVEGMGTGGDVYYQPDFIPLDVAQRSYAEIDKLDTYQPMLKMYGRTFPQSRSIAAYSTIPGAKLKYSGTEVRMHHPFPPALAEMQGKLEGELGVKFNHCMLNRYEDGNVYIGKHSDNLNNLVIASVSLGAERTFIMSPRMPSRARSGAKHLLVDDEELKDRSNLKWKLADGSLVVMQGRTQEFWKHEIPKEASVKQGRISLTFRQLV